MTHDVAPARLVVLLSFGLVLIVVPFLVFATVQRPAAIASFQIIGVLVCVIGAAIALSCVVNFAFVGRGTPAPFVPPRRLVMRGPYRHVRNPMYVGVGLFFAGAAIFYQSALALAYVALFFVSSHLFIVLYEEPTLRRTFGAEYSTYCERAGRWWPRSGRVDGRH